MFSQQILSDKLLLAITDWQKSNFNDEFKLEQVTIFFIFFDNKKLGRRWPMWQSYLGVTIIAPYLLGPGPCWGCKGTTVSHNFPVLWETLVNFELLREVT